MKYLLNVNKKVHLKGLRSAALGRVVFFPACLVSPYADSILMNVSDMPHRCKFGMNKLNIQACDVDLMVFCPTTNGLQQILKHILDV